MTKKSKLNIILPIAFTVALLDSMIYCGEFASSGSMFKSVLQLSAIYMLLAVSLNLLNGFTGLFSLGQAGFMTIGAYTYAIFTIPVKSRASVYYLYGVADWLKNIELPVIIALIVAGLAAALLAAIIGAPVLRLKSDYLAIATLGFAEVVRIVVASSPLNKITNGSLGLKKIPGFESYYGIFIVAFVCIAIIMLLLNSTYGRALKAIRDDEIAAESMGINLSRHKQISFVISAFFSGIGGALMAMYLGAVSSTTFTIAVTYFILLIVVIGGMGSVSGSVISAFIVIAAREWWLRFLDDSPEGFILKVFFGNIMLARFAQRRGVGVAAKQILAVAQH